MAITLRRGSPVGHVNSCRRPSGLVGCAWASAGRVALVWQTRVVQCRFRSRLVESSGRLEGSNVHDVRAAGRSPREDFRRTIVESRMGPRQPS